MYVQDVLYTYITTIDLVDNLKYHNVHVSTALSSRQFNRQADKSKALNKLNNKMYNGGDKYKPVVSRRAEIK